MLNIKDNKKALAAHRRLSQNARVVIAPERVQPQAKSVPPSAVGLGERLARRAW
jgi:hypothetical protein